MIVCDGGQTPLIHSISLFSLSFFCVPKSHASFLSKPIFEQFESLLNPKPSSVCLIHLYISYKPQITLPPLLTFSHPHSTTVIILPSSSIAKACIHCAQIQWQPGSTNFMRFIPRSAPTISLVKSTHSQIDD